MTLHTKRILGIVCVVVFGAGACAAQSNDSQTVTNWGESVQGVQLSISITTNVFRVGSSATIASVIRNLSTNDITVDESDPTISFDVLLIDGTGILYHAIPMTPFYRLRLMRQLVTIKAGEESVESIPVILGKAFSGETVEHGDFTLKAMRHFSTSESSFALKSSPIKVRIIK